MLCVYICMVTQADMFSRTKEWRGLIGAGRGWASGPVGIGRKTWRGGDLGAIDAVSREKRMSLFSQSRDITFQSNSGISLSFFLRSIKGRIRVGCLSGRGFDSSLPWPVSVILDCDRP